MNERTLHTRNIRVTINDFTNSLYNDNVLTLNEQPGMLVIQNGGNDMPTTNLNIRTDRDVKEHADRIFSELGLTMTSAINMFLRTTIRENGIPFPLKLDTPNQTTAQAIEEGRRIAADSSVKGYTSMDDLKKALDLNA